MDRSNNSLDSEKRYSANVAFHRFGQPLLLSIMMVLALAISESVFFDDSGEISTSKSGVNWIYRVTDRAIYPDILTILLTSILIACLAAICWNVYRFKSEIANDIVSVLLALGTVSVSIIGLGLPIFYEVNETIRDGYENLIIEEGYTDASLSWVQEVAVIKVGVIEYSYEHSISTDTKGNIQMEISLIE